MWESPLWLFLVAHCKPSDAYDEITLHYGIEYGKAMMKLRTLLDDRHNDDEIAERLKQIDADIYAMEEALKHDLDFRGLLIHL